MLVDSPIYSEGIFYEFLSAFLYYIIEFANFNLSSEVYTDIPDLFLKAILLIFELTPDEFKMTLFT